MLASFKSKIWNVFCPAIFLYFQMVCRVYFFAYLTFDRQAPCRHDFDCVGEQFPGHLMDMFESPGIHALFYKKSYHILG